MKNRSNDADATEATGLLGQEEDAPAKQAQSRLEESQRKESARKEQDTKNLAAWVKATV